MAAQRRFQADSRQQSFDFGSVLFDSTAAAEQSVKRTLDLLGSNAAAVDADVDAARMRARVLVQMARRASGNPVSQQTQDALALLMFCVMQALREGSLCVGREKFRRQSEIFAAAMASRTALSAQTFKPEAFASFETLVDGLRHEGFVGEPGSTGGTGPFAGGPALLVSERAEGQTLVYTQKSYGEEALLGRYLARLSEGAVSVAAVLPEKEAERAGELALANRLTVISGGPGTGKTTAVVKLLEKLLEKRPEAKIVLAAPTGKAASRMKEAVAGNASRIENPVIRDKLMGLGAGTLHRVLYTPGADGRVASKDNPLDADIVVVDESSMIEIRLAGDLFERIDPERTKVILLGDRYQLAAVGPGSFFADVSDLAGPLHDNISHLTKSWRFDSSKALGVLAEAAREGDVETVAEAFRQHGQNDPAEDNCLRLHEERPEAELTDAFKSWFKKELKVALAAVARLRGNREYRDKQTAARELARIYFSIGVLAANREGPMSAQAVNDFAEEIFKEQGIAYPAFRPMIVRCNDPLLEVYNGDTGVVMPGDDWFEGGDFDAARAEVYFPDADRFVRFGQIGHIEPAFAITIHQSQGSEYHHVAVLMPVNEASGLASRELFYTAVTRVRDERSENGTLYGTLDVFGAFEVIAKAVRTPVRREGGLARRIAQARTKTE